MNREQILEELERKKKHNRFIAKRVLICFVSAAVILAVIAGVFALWSYGWFISLSEGKTGGYIFEPNYSYEYDIMQDEDYLAILNSEPFINLGDKETGVTESLLPENYDKEGADVKLLTTLITAIQMGNVDTYNSCFSRGFFIAEGKRKAAESDDPAKYENYTDDMYAELGKENGFTMQQIYSVYMILIDEQKDVKLDTKTYKYELKYKIKENNATFRADMGSDVYRPQEITIFEDCKTGDIKIIRVDTFSSAPLIETVLGWRIALIAVASVLVISADVIITVKLMKKLSRSCTLTDDKSDKAKNESEEGDNNDEKTLGN